MFRRSMRLMLAACWLVGALWADDHFVGEWKLNPSKSKLTDKMKVEKVSDNKYVFNFGGDPETIVLDGTDQPGIAGTTLAVTVVAPDQWKVVRKKDGHMLITANWKLSPNGGTLTDNFNEISPNGSASTVDYVYKRKGEGSGFAGKWVSTSEQLNFSYVLHIKSFDADGLSIDDPSSQLTRNIKFDGKDYPNEGANAAILAASSIRKVDERTLELTDKGANGKVYGVLEMKLSPDFKTLTMTPRAAQGDDTNVFVFERQ
jgi:hypothetical protein